MSLKSWLLHVGYVGVGYMHNRSLCIAITKILITRYLVIPILNTPIAALNVKGDLYMKICYIPPKTTKPKKRVIKLYTNPITSLLLMLSHYCDPELTIIMLACLILAIIAAGQQVWISGKSKAQREREKMDNLLKEWERTKKIDKMYEEMREANTPKECKNVSVKNLI